MIEDKTYISTTKQGNLFNITYFLNRADTLTYQLDASEKKPKITFEVTSAAVPEQDILLLIALGFYSIRNVAIEVLANDFIVSAVA